MIDSVQNSVAAAMRTQELANRRRRQQILLNEYKLLDENVEGLPGVAEAVKAMQARLDSDARFAAIRVWESLTYWQRLWRAIRNQPLV